MRIIDLHVDTISRSVERGWDLAGGERTAHVDLPRLASSPVSCLGLSLWCDPPLPAPQRLWTLMEATERLVDANAERLRLVRTAEDLEHPAGTVALVPGVEGAHAFGGSLSVLERALDLGVRWVTLTWNNANAWADSCFERGPTPGLTLAGREALAVLTERGCVADLAHASQDAFWQTLEARPKAVWVSHTACAALAPHPRNLADDQIRGIARAGGVCGIICCPEFLLPENPDAAALDTLADHLEHMVSVGGTECAAIGSDFDGVDRLPRGMQGVQDLARLIDRLRRRGWSEAQLQAVCWDNPRRVLGKVLPAPGTTGTNA
ncbi:MAG: hypothetical protein GF355_11070 [Candidatus Eisenbacteria bacterium]|nr:hypothetical protein [Candidatus Eisenbacteria bacterium]